MPFAAPVTGKIVDEKSSRVVSLFYYLLSGQARDSGERCMVYSPSWDKKRAKTIYKTIDLERSCTVLYRQDREWKTL
jgi:hypothetical protein